MSFFTEIIDPPLSHSVPIYNVIVFGHFERQFDKEILNIQYRLRVTHSMVGLGGNSLSVTKPQGS